MTVNNDVITDPAYQVDADADDVRFDGKPLQDTEYIYIMLNKPPKVLTTVMDDRKRTTVMNLIFLPQRIFPVGRLDYDTCGLLLLTNDGDLAHRLMHPRYQIPKTYRIVLNKPLDQPGIAKLKSGIKIGPNEKVTPDDISVNRKRDSKEVRITLHEGKKREIKRMFQAIDYQVRELERIVFAGIRLKKLPLGTWRYLTGSEVRYLKRLTSDVDDKPSL